MRLIGLTGGVGSGKSEAARCFLEFGLPVIDADKVGHDVISPGGAAAEAVTEAFGPDVTVDGVIDRAKLAEVVFRDVAARRKLNDIVHPAIMLEVGTRCAQLADDGHDVVLVEAALLGERGARDPWLSGLILVTCPRALRIERLAAIRGMLPDDTERRMAAQTSPEQKVAFADWVIDNSGTLDALRARVEEVVHAIRQRRQ